MKCKHSLQYLVRSKYGHYCIKCNPDNIKAITYKDMPTFLINELKESRETKLDNIKLKYK